MDDLNYIQLSERFPICQNSDSSSEGWAHLLKQWRDAKKLVERKHWRYGPPANGGRSLTRYYDLRRVVRLIVAEHQSGKPRPRIAFLCQTYTEEMAEILTSVPPATSDDKQAITP